MKPAALSAILLASRMAAAAVFPLDAGSRLADWDIIFKSPAATPSEGLPIGNGRMGTMVWTVPASIVFQINRTDNFTANRLHDGQYIARQASPNATDQLLSLASFSLTFDRKVFDAPTRFEQRLSLSNAQVKLHAETRSGALDADAFVAAGDDVLSLRVMDHRERRGVAVAELSLWRPPDSRNGTQTWRYRMAERSGKIVLTHDVTEGKFVSRYAVAVGVEGRAVTFEMTDPRHARLRIADGPGPYRVLLASASANDATDVAQKAIASLTRAMRTDYAGALAAHRAWWKAFWNRSFLSAHTSDGTADYLTRLYNLHLYLMASSSRGALPPKFNGSIWTTMQDQRRWGAQYWLWHTESLYYPLLSANQIELTDPYFRMYRDQLPRA
ncbi:MAG: glycoside hydrolase N-terminal domain-containing protein, partial [Bryobacteraceae bacterium]